MAMFGDYGRHMFGNYGMGGGGMIFMVLFWLLLIVAVIFLIKTITAKGCGSGPVESAEDILKKRYAKGEIDQAEFAKRKKDLQN
jgi:putative membrane protein